VPTRGHEHINYSLLAKIVVVLVLGFYVHLQMNDYESRQLYKIHILIIV
jgi:hypothetical protein